MEQVARIGNPRQRARYVVLISKLLPNLNRRFSAETGFEGGYYTDWRYGKFKKQYNG